MSASTHFQELYKISKPRRHSEARPSSVGARPPGYLINVYRTMANHSLSALISLFFTILLIALGQTFKSTLAASRQGTLVSNQGI